MVVEEGGWGREHSGSGGYSSQDSGPVGGIFLLMANSHSQEKSNLQFQEMGIEATIHLSLKGGYR